MEEVNINWTNLVKVFALLCLVFSLTAMGQTKTDKPMETKALAALVEELKGEFSQFVPDKNKAKLVGEKWDKHKDLTGKTKTEVISLLYRDVESVIKDSGTRYYIFAYLQYLKGNSLDSNDSTCAQFRKTKSKISKTDLVQTATRTVKKNSIGMNLVYIQPGEFMMGSNDDPKSIGQQPVHKVKISQGFWMQTTEVSQAQWKAVMGNIPSKINNCPRCPIEGIGWNDVHQFIAKLNAQKDGYIYRLPTEAEWEYSARAGTTTEFAFGVCIGPDQANFWTASKVQGKSVPVGSYQPNAWGLYDMHGNVWEFVQDWFDEGYYAKSPITNPTGPSSGDSRVIRGGSWMDFGTAHLGSAFRSATYTSDASDGENSFSVGFRVAARQR